VESEVSQENDDIDKIGVFDTYFRLYGGWPALLTSPYFWIALLVSLLCAPVWLEEENNERLWLSMAVEIIPSLMAFSLGGMSILLAFSSEKLMEVIQQGGRSDSLYMKATASFFHFILIQTMSLIAVFFTSAYSVNLISWFGFFLMTYGLLVAIAIAANLLRLAQQFNLTSAQQRSLEKTEKK
jgi:hypothetical protein